MKLLALSLMFFSAVNAHADNWTENCASQAKPELVLTYPTEVVGDVVGGKITATVRKGVRCFQKGDVLVLKDSKTSAVIGKVTLQEVIFSTLTTLSPKVVARSAEANMTALQAKLVAIYGETIRAEKLTELYFSFAK